MKLIVITVLGVLLLASIGAATSGATTGMTDQAGQSSVYLFDVPATAEHGGGTLMIALNQHRFVFDGTGEPGTVYYLQYMLAGIPGVHQFASAAATSSGTLHMEGTWIKKFGTWATKLANIQSTHMMGFAAATPSGNESETLPSEPTFALSATPPPLSAQLHFYSFQQDQFIYNNGVWTMPFVFDAHGSAGMLYELYASISYAQDNQLLYSGSSDSLSYTYAEPYSARLYVKMDAAYAYADLYVYDSAGNSAHDRVDILHDVWG